MKFFVVFIGLIFLQSCILKSKNEVNQGRSLANSTDNLVPALYCNGHFAEKLGVNSDRTLTIKYLWRASSNFIAKNRSGENDTVAADDCLNVHSGAPFIDDVGGWPVRMGSVLLCNGSKVKVKGFFGSNDTEPSSVMVENLMKNKPGVVINESDQYDFFRLNFSNPCKVLVAKKTNYIFSKDNIIRCYDDSVPNFEELRAKAENLLTLPTYKAKILNAFRSRGSHTSVELLVFSKHKNGHDIDGVSEYKVVIKELKQRDCKKVEE